MSAAAQTKIFGIRLGVDPKILVIGLIAVAALLFWYNSGGEEGAPQTARVTRPEATEHASIPARARSALQRRAAGSQNERTTLRVRPIDATSGDVDPTLRLDLLTRLQTVALPSTERNLFEAGAEAPTLAGAGPIKGPIMPPKPLAPPSIAVVAPGPPPVNIPFKYYGFAKAASSGVANRGFFLDGDNVLVASEGELLQKRYLVVELSANMAKLEDTQLKQGQTLQVVPEAAAE